MANDWDLVISDLNKIKQNSIIVRRALSTVLAKQKQRIFVEGKTASGSKIGTYSTRKTSIGKRKQARNTGKTTFPGGYAEYKRLIGKNPGFVILRDTDQMMMDYGLEILGVDTYGFGFNNTLNFEKSQWMEEKYKKRIFDESASEGKLLMDLLTK